MVAVLREQDSAGLQQDGGPGSLCWLRTLGVPRANCQNTVDVDTRKRVRTDTSEGSDPAFVLGKGKKLRVGEPIEEDGFGSAIVNFPSEQSDNDASCGDGVLLSLDIGFHVVKKLCDGEGRVVSAVLSDGVHCQAEHGQGVVPTNVLWCRVCLPGWDDIVVSPVPTLRMVVNVTRDKRLGLVAPPPQGLDVTAVVNRVLRSSVHLSQIFHDAVRRSFAGSQGRAIRNVFNPLPREILIGRICPLYSLQLLLRISSSSKTVFTRLVKHGWMLVHTF
ncbi:hypothetical protein Bbelb_018990 [Branchiostoma belcheri]|nr:hypothetical protein Bbelb_018990 [Branchiostoma belcheri]